MLAFFSFYCNSLPSVIQIPLSTSCIQFFVASVFCEFFSIAWLALHHDQLPILPPWDCSLYSTGKVLSFIHVINPCSCSSSLFGQDGWIWILFSFYVIVVRLYLSLSITHSFSSSWLGHKAISVHNTQQIFCLLSSPLDLMLSQ